MDNIILVSLGVIVLGLVLLVWVILKIRQLDEMMQEDNSENAKAQESLISLSPLSGEQLGQKTKPKFGQVQAGVIDPAVEESIKNIEHKLEFIDSTLKSLSQAIIDSKMQPSGETQVTKELKSVLDSIFVKVESISKRAGGGNAESSGAGITEVLNLVKSTANKVNGFEAVLRQKAVESHADGGYNIGIDVLNQRVEDLKQTLMGLRDGGEEILSQITNKLDILNKIITTHITQADQR